MNSEWQHKMLNYEVVPPANTWDKIAAALDDSNLEDGFPRKLYHLEVIPPNAAWNKITASLDEEPVTTARNYQRAFPLLRYAAAAAVIGLIAFGSIKIFSGKSAEKGMAKISNPAKDTNNPLTQKIIKIPGNNIAIPDETRDDVALEESKHTLARLDMSVTRRIKQRTIHDLSGQLANATNEINPEENFLPPETSAPSVASNETRSDMISRYVMLMTPDGNIIRMSKKWGNLLCCVSGEEQDEDCKDQLQRWREKIACSPINASPGNFMDILSLVNSLQD